MIYKSSILKCIKYQASPRMIYKSSILKCIKYQASPRLLCMAAFRRCRQRSIYIPPKSITQLNIPLTSQFQHLKPLILYPIKLKKIAAGPTKGHLPHNQMRCYFSLKFRRLSHPRSALAYLISNTDLALRARPAPSTICTVLLPFSISK